MKREATTILILFCSVPAILFAQKATGKVLSLSTQTSASIGCHKVYTPGIVEDWLRSLHSKTPPSYAFRKPEIGRRISAKKISAPLEKVAVGCYECHSLNAGRHKDNFDHMGFKINVVVSPNDCSTCHPVEAKEFSGSKKAHAVGNLTKNPIYHALVETIISKKTVKEGKVLQQEVSDFTRQETCFSQRG